ncbi:hypothetical protein MA9V1_100 [Chryseobacterium phage MA9V-1]|nr:hypothetical protein MA9V1_100 [Chryseobacterium phage MA9V-1]
MKFTITFSRNECNYVITSDSKVYEHLSNGCYGLYGPKSNNKGILVDINKLGCKTEIGALIWYCRLHRLLKLYERFANITSLRFDINNENYIKLDMDIEMLKYIKANDDYSDMDIMHANAMQTLFPGHPIRMRLAKCNPGFFKMLPRAFMKLLKAEFDHKFPGFTCSIYKCWDGQHYELQSNAFAEHVVGIRIANSEVVTTAWKWANDADRAFRKYYSFNELLVFSEICIDARAVERYESLG